MASFKNTSQAQLMLTDENGIMYKFNPGEQRDGLSNYFYKHTAQGGASTGLTLIGELDDNGDIPAPMDHTANRLRQPGPLSPYLSSSYSGVPPGLDRRRELIFDMANENANTRRRVKSTDVGIHEIPSPLKSNNIAEVTNLTNATNLDGTSGDGPMLIDGRRATAEDAAANPAVEEGEYYTVFGELVVSDDSASTSGDIIYFSVKGTTNFTFVPASDYPAAAPTPPTSGNSVTVATPRITVGAFGNSPQAADGVAVNAAKFAQSPNTAAKLAAALSGVANPNGYYWNLQENVLFYSESAQVHQISVDASANIS